MKLKLLSSLFAFIIIANVTKAQTSAKDTLFKTNAIVGKLISTVFYLEAQESFSKVKNKAEALKDLEAPLKNSPLKEVILNFMGNLYEKSKISNNPDYIYFNSTGNEILPAIAAVMRGKLIKTRCCPRPILEKTFFPGVDFSSPSAFRGPGWRWWLNGFRKLVDLIDDLVNGKL
jgi:hypothetical protein